MVSESLNFSSYPVALISLGFLFLILSISYFSKFTGFSSSILEVITLGIGALLIFVGILKLKELHNLQMEKLWEEISALKRK
jgi:hypothetical protein